MEDLLFKILFVFVLTFPINEINLFFFVLCGSMIAADSLEVPKMIFKSSQNSTVETHCAWISRLFVPDKANLEAHFSTCFLE